jgi:hypothetical protein
MNNECLRPFRDLLTVPEIAPQLSRTRLETGLTLRRKPRSAIDASSHRRPARGDGCDGAKRFFRQGLLFLAIILLAYKTRRRLSTVIVDAKVGCRMQITNECCLYGKE